MKNKTRFEEIMDQYSVMEYRQKISKGYGIYVTPDELVRIKDKVDFHFICEKNMILKDDFSKIAKIFIEDSIKKSDEVIF